MHLNARHVHFKRKSDAFKLEISRVARFSTAGQGGRKALETRVVPTAEPLINYQETNLLSNKTTFHVI